MNEQERPMPYPEDAEIPVHPVPGEPVDVWDQINKYGTYEIQDTTDTNNVFPTIGPKGGWRNCIEALDIRENKSKKTER